MNRQNHGLLLGATLLALAGCLNVSFSVRSKAQFVIDTHQSSYSGVSVVDLSTNSDFQKHKGNINGVSIENIALSIASLNTGNQATQLTSATLALRADGAPADGSQDVQVGSLTAPLVFHSYLPTSAGGGGLTFSLPLTGAQAADKFLMDNVVKGSGKFSAVVTAQTDNAETHITLQVDFTNSFSYGLL